MRWNFIIIRFLKSAEVFLLMCWICAETLQEMRSNFFVFTFSQKCWNFSTDLLNLRWNFVRNTPKKALNFFQDLYLKCAEIILFYVFSRTLKFFYGCAEFVLKLCKKWAEILLFYVFSKALNFFYGFAEFALKLCKKWAEIILFYVFSRAMKFFYGCAEFGLKLCKKNAEVLWFSIFLKSA